VPWATSHDCHGYHDGGLRGSLKHSAERVDAEPQQFVDHQVQSKPLHPGDIERGGPPKLIDRQVSASATAPDVKPLLVLGAALVLAGMCILTRFERRRRALRRLGPSVRTSGAAKCTSGTIRWFRRE
jgi:hypothetical protein